MDGRRWQPLVLVVLAASVAMPPVQAHNATIVAENYVRFLNDCSDDWGGHSAIRDGHDLVALDLTERWLAQASEPALFVLLTVGFGFAQTGSQGGPLRDEIELTTANGAVRVRLATNDNTAISAESGPGLLVPDVVLPPRPSLLPNGNQDGSRILLEFGIIYSKLGMSVGDKVTAIKVQAYARTERGDFMPGGYYLAGVSSGGERDCPQSGHQGSGDPGTLYIREDYALRGTEEPYVDLSVNTRGIAVSGNQSGFLRLDVQSKLSKQSQRAILTLDAPAPWLASASPSSHNIAGDDTGAFDVRVQVPDGPGRNDTLTLILTTDTGGRATREVPLYWYPAGVAATVPSSPSPEPSPSAPLVLLVLAFGLALARRARSRCG